jgi:DNA-binding response OmpR family regulator
MPKVIIAEDDLMIADEVEETLIEHGYTVCGIARTVAEGVALGRAHHPDLALLDLRLAEGGLGTEIAHQLKPLFPLGVLYATGNSGNIPLNDTQGEAVISKPYRAEALLRALEIVVSMTKGEGAMPPFPRGFQVLPRSAVAAAETYV